MKTKVASKILLPAIALALLGGTVSQLPARAADGPAVAGDPKKGRETFVQVGCYQCHGYSGQGGEVAPKLTPGLRPFGAFQHIVRHPLSVMPHYSVKVLTDDEVTNIYAYLASVKPPRTSRDIPMLRDLSASPAGGARR